MPGVTIRFYIDRGQIVDDRLDAGLQSVGARAVAAATGRGVAEGAGTIAVLGVPVVRAGERVRIFDLVDDPGVRASGGNHLIVRRRQRIAVAVTEPDRIAS